MLEEMKQNVWMRNRTVKTILIGILISAVCLCLAGCSGEKDRFYGKWGYIHDTETTVMNFKSAGRLVYDGVDYTYTADDTFLHLTDKNGQTSDLRYAFDGEQMYIYRPTEYEYTQDGSPDGLLGVWVDPINKWSFEFTTEGTFKEDGYFPGQYLDDAENGILRLIYNDRFVDTVIYYSIEGNTLRMEYPWCMAKTTK